MDEALAADIDDETVVAEVVSTKERTADGCNDAGPLVRVTCNVQGDGASAVGGDRGAVSSREGRPVGFMGLLVRVVGMTLTSAPVSTKK